MPIHRSGGIVEEALSHSVIGAFFHVHTTLGYGFLEHVYISALEAELKERGHRAARETVVDVFYKGLPIARQRLDFVVDSRLVIEVKSSEKLHRDACRQLFNYLRATDLEVGLLLHFGREANFYRVICTNMATRPQ